MIPITYIGHRPIYRDGACGSELVFEQGQTLLVENEFAMKMLRHPSVYKRGDAAEVEAAPVQEAAKTKAKDGDDDEQDSQDSRDSIASMNKDALAIYAKTHFNVDLDKRSKVGDLRIQVTTLFDQFGVK